MQLDFCRCWAQETSLRNATSSTRVRNNKSSPRTGGYHYPCGLNEHEYIDTAKGLSLASRRLIFATAVPSAQSGGQGHEVLQAFVGGLDDSSSSPPPPLFRSSHALIPRDATRLPRVYFRRTALHRGAHTCVHVLAHTWMHRVCACVRRRAA